MDNGRAWSVRWVGVLAVAVGLVLVPALVACNAGLTPTPEPTPVLPGTPGPTAPSNTVEMNIADLQRVTEPAGWLVLLRERGGNRYLPVTIGDPEAHAIALALDGITPPRPLTHDLLYDTINQLGGTLDYVVITDLRGGTFFAELHVVRGDNGTIIDARPSDAMALALRAGVAIRATEAVLDAAGVTPDRDGPEDHILVSPPPG